MKIQLLLWAFFLAIPERTKAQTECFTQSVTIPTKVGSLSFNICKTTPNIKYLPDKEYTWYDRETGINETKGGAQPYLLHGELKEYKAGSLRYLSNFKLGLLHGISKTYNDNGSLIRTDRYENGLLIYQKFKPKNGDGWIEIIGEIFKKGTMRIEYGEDGKITYKELILDKGLRKKWINYENGKVKYEYTEGLGTGIMEDTFIYYHPNGKIGTIGCFEMDAKKGQWKFYNENGQIQGIEEYRIHKEYYPDGELRLQGGEFWDGNKKEWVKDGRWFYYKENGDWQEVENYKYGEFKGTGFKKE